jgi:hypothetical protein
MTDMNGRERMKKLLICGAVLAAATLSTSAFALDRANTAQKGSLLIFPKIDVSKYSETIVRLENTYYTYVNVQCYWQNATKAYRSQEITLTPFQPVTIRASTYLPDWKGKFWKPTNERSAYYVENAKEVGELKCWAVTKEDGAEMSFNHLTGSATILEYDDATAWTYTAWAFRCLSPTTEKALCGTTPGNLELNGSEYEKCPSRLTVGFAPFKDYGDSKFGRGGHRVMVDDTDLTVATCNQDYRVEDRALSYTTLVFDVWNEHEDRYDGASQCMNSWIEKQLGDIQTASDNFSYGVLGTSAARMRIRALGGDSFDDDCEEHDKTGFRPSTEDAAIVGVISTEIQFPNKCSQDSVCEELVEEREAVAGTNLVGLGDEFDGNIRFTPRGGVPQGPVGN